MIQNQPYTTYSAFDKTGRPERLRQRRFFTHEHSPAQRLQRLLAGGALSEYLRHWGDEELAERDEALIFAARCELTCRYPGRNARQMRAARTVAAKLDGHIKFRRRDRYFLMPAIDGEAVDYLLRQVVSVNRVVSETGVPRTVVERWIEEGRLPALKGDICNVEMTLVSATAAQRLLRLARSSA